MGIPEYFYLAAGLLFGAFATGGYGVLSLSPPLFHVARRCFWVAAFLFGSIGIVWGITATESFPIRALVVGVTAAIAAVGLSETVRWTKVLERKSASATVIRNAFSQTQSIKMLPSFLGGTYSLNLDNLATLRQHIQYSSDKITMLLDVVTVDLAQTNASPGIKVEDAHIYNQSTGQQYVFDTDKNRRHEISVGGRTFIVTLQRINRMNVPQVSNPLEYVFGISEK